MRRWLTIHVPLLLLVLAYGVIVQRDLNHELDAAHRSQQRLQGQYDALKLQEEREDQAMHRLAGENRDLREALAQERARRAQDRFALLDAQKRASRSRSTVVDKAVDNSSSAAWASTVAAIKVANCESGDRHSWDHYNGDPTQRTGSYYGKWQMGLREWHDTGGTGYPSDAPVSEQDYRAWLLWKARGWQPWSCARIMGVL